VPNKLGEGKTKNQSHKKGKSGPEGKGNDARKKKKRDKTLRRAGRKTGDFSGFPGGGGSCSGEQKQTLCKGCVRQSTNGTKGQERKSSWRRGGGKKLSGVERLRVEGALGKRGNSRTIYWKGEIRKVREQEGKKGTAPWLKRGGNKRVPKKKRD